MKQDKQKKILRLVKQMEKLAYKLKQENKAMGEAVGDLLWEIKNDIRPEYLDDDEIKIYD